MFYTSDLVTNESNILGGALRDAVGCNICACPSPSVAIPTQMISQSCHVLFSRVKSFVCDVQMIASHIYFELVDCNCSHVQMIASHVFLFYLWSAIVCMYERLQVISYFVFEIVEYNHLYVRIIASHVILNFPICHHLYA
jgi:hypothetical protein